MNSLLTSSNKMYNKEFGMLYIKSNKTYLNLAILSTIKLINTTHAYINE